jgi:hypothetical protein
MTEARSASDAGKIRLLSLDQLDGRTVAARAVRDTLAALVSDLGGEEMVSAAQRQIAQRAAILGSMLNDLGVRWLNGDQIDVSTYATLSNAERRNLETIGIRRQARDVKTLAQHLASKREAIA